MKPKKLALIGALLAGGLTAVLIFAPRAVWSPEELSALRSLWIGHLEPPPADPSNRVADDERAAEFGQRLFFDKRLSANGQVSCASCHQPDKQFQDGIALAKGVGTTDRRTMSIVGSAHSAWQFWDGRKDSQWSQALGPLESSVEHGGDRTQYAHLVAQHYRAEYEALFGAMPDFKRLPEHAGPVKDPAARAAWERMGAQQRDAVTRVFANLGKAIAAYERRLMPGASRFDKYVEAVGRGDREAMDAALTPNEVAGLRLFIGKGNCLQCHNSPLLSNNDFHNTGVPPGKGLPADAGRLSGLQQLLKDEFNCLGRHSDAKPEQCGELQFLATDSRRQMRQFKVPSLRNVGERAPYMHAGQFATLAETVAHYNQAPAAPQGHSELKPLGMSRTEAAQIVEFLKTLSGPIQADRKWLEPPAPPQ
ncbi:cytochrome c peroxidase [Ramlibacter sp. 2FC]|uniref:cytochrome-c peroxidase n=1 Tax=Ramlibacter sp. 2FC TaxID=2502188 RepID=UPI0010F73640|nr:cytochrome c peroxidase [Ramlibacter sp. 2FC]